MEKADVARWLRDYVAAWKSYDRDAIVALFADQARYRWHADDVPTTGSQAIADAWLAEPDAEGSYDAAYEPIAVDGAVAVAVGSSTYANPDGSIRQQFDNCFVTRFDDQGRCLEFTEYYNKRDA